MNYFTQRCQKASQLVFQGIQKLLAVIACVSAVLCWCCLKIGQNFVVAVSSYKSIYDTRYSVHKRNKSETNNHRTIAKQAVGVFNLVKNAVKFYAFWPLRAINFKFCKQKCPWSVLLLHTFTKAV